MYRMVMDCRPRGQRGVGMPRRCKKEARLRFGTRRRVPNTWKEEGEDKTLFKRMVTFGSKTSILGDTYRLKATEMAASKNFSSIQGENNTNAGIRINMKSII
jgi:hypothetical protein